MTEALLSGVRTCEDREAVSHTAAKLFASLAERAVADCGRFFVALSGGSTPRRIHQLLAAAPFRNGVDWPCVEFFWGDERAVPPDHPDSNYAMARETLLDGIGAPRERIHRMRGEAVNLDRAARDYQLEITRVLRADPTGTPPRFHLMLQGLGVDGHTASLFPHTEALRERSRWVVANHVPQLHTRRLTVTFPLLERAERVVFIVAGVEKAAALAQILEGPPDPEGLPAQALWAARPDVLWLIDRAAASRLSRVKGWNQDRRSR